MEANERRFMKIAITGASGLVGSALVPYLRNGGHTVICLVRAKPVGADEAFWDPAEEVLNPDELSGVDALINLAGANLAKGRWTAKRKRLIRESRIDSLLTLAEAVRLCPQRPSVVISASAAGIYGDRGETWLDEETAPGTGFLAEVCREWESALAGLNELGVRTVALRLGLVLSDQGGALGKMLPAFKCGLGGRLGSGRQWMSWIAEGDLHRIMGQALENETWRGAINAVSPHPVTNAQFTRILAAALRRPAILPVPAWGLRLLFGEMADEALLASSRVKPRVLQNHGFQFSQPELSGAFEEIFADPTLPH